MLLDALTPDTSVYMIAGYTIFFVVTAIYLSSLYIRTRNLDRDLDALKDLEQAEQAPVAAPASPKAKAPRTKSNKRTPARKKAARKS